MENISQNIQVAVRIRNPPAPRTPKQNQSSKLDRTGFVAFADQPKPHVSVSITDPDQRKGTKQFSYDRVFAPDDDQTTVYQVIEPIVDKFLQGYNGCVFAYGQTSR